MTIIITTMQQLPEHCYECPLCTSDMRCKADEEKRFSQEWRPYWCPLQVSPFDDESKRKGAEHESSCSL